MHIREAVESDFEQIAHVASTSYVDAFGEYFLDKKALEKETRERRSEKYFKTVFGIDTILVAIDNDIVVGYLQFGEPALNFEVDVQNSIELKRLYVLTEYHSQGIGRSLIEKMFEHGRLKNIKHVYLEVWEKNPKAVGLYKSIGFKDTGRTRPFYENGVEVGYDSVYELKMT